MFTHHLLQIGIGGTDHPYIHLPRATLSQRFKRLFLQHPQQLHLARQVQFTDFIQENRPFIRQFETSFPVGHRIGKRPFLVPEHLTLKQSLRNTS
ncbi:putative uncharacterized protein [Bacteroides sp. CAG:875]|nr:putative uncharacterized protein [Bacteroides sp. CAG:875]